MKCPAKKLQRQKKKRRRKKKSEDEKPWKTWLASYHHKGCWGSPRAENTRKRWWHLEKGEKMEYAQLDPSTLKWTQEKWKNSKH